MHACINLSSAWKEIQQEIWQSSSFHSLLYFTLSLSLSLSLSLPLYLVANVISMAIRCLCLFLTVINSNTLLFTLLQPACGDYYSKFGIKQDSWSNFESSILTNLLYLRWILPTKVFAQLSLVNFSCITILCSNCYKNTLKFCCQYFCLWTIIFHTLVASAYAYTR